MAYLAYKSLDLNMARKLLEPLAEHERYRKRRPSLVYYLGRCHFGLGHFREAIKLLEDFAERWPALADQCIADKL